MARETRNALSVLVFAALALLFMSEALVAATLAREGNATCVIVVADDAIAAERTAAKELAHYLENVTGAKPAVQNAPGEGTNVFVGGSERIEKMLADVDFTALGTDGIVMRTVGDDLVLSGGRPRGTLYAVYTFLQDVVGCRWYAGTNRPTDPVEMIPRKPTLEIAELDVVYRPPLDFRQHYTEAVRDPLFAVKLRLNGRESLPVIPGEFGGSAFMGGGHTLLRQFLKAAEHFAQHPEWYAYSRASVGR